MIELKNDKSFSNQSDDMEMIRLTKENPNNYYLIYNKYKGLLSHYILNRFGFNMNVEDLVAETLAKAYEKLYLYDCNNSNFSTWLYNVCNNHTIDSLRKHNKAEYCCIDELKYDIENNESNLHSFKKFHVDNTLSNIIDKERKTKILNVLNVSLDENDKVESKMKELITLRYLNELSYTEISQITDLCEGSLKALLHRGKSRMYNYIKNNNIHF